MADLIARSNSSGGAAELGGDMKRVDASQPTKVMREELEGLGVPLPDADEQLRLSKLFNVKLEQWRFEEHKGVSVSWFNLFAEIDEDGSGYVTFDEVRSVVQQKLKLSKKEVSDNQLKALWCTWDVDNSNQVMPEEVAGFLKKGMPEKEKPGVLKKEKTIAQFELDEKDMKRVDATVPTVEMREELEGLGVALPDDMEQLKLSMLFNERLEQWRFEEHKGASISWFNLFAEIDEDGSGYITYDELKSVCRTKLKLKGKDLAENDLKALWCVLDKDDSNQIFPEEIAGFLRRGVADKPKFTKENKKPTVSQFELDEQDMKRVDANVPTKQMKADLEAEGVALPSEEEMVRVSKLLNAKLEEWRYNEHKAESTSWFNLFNEVDTDGSGYVTYDELRRVVRKKLSTKASELPDSTLKGVWCVLDADSSNQIFPEEMSSWLKKGAAKKDKGGLPLPKKPTVSQFELDALDDKRIDHTVPTKQMKENLDNLGVELPDEMAVIRLSMLFNEKLEEYRYMDGKAASTSWFNLFREVDEDGSGYITYDELKQVTYIKLKISKSEITETGLQALWCVLDADSSNQIFPEEISGFFRKGIPEKEKRGPLKKERTIAQFELDEKDTKRIDYTVPTKEMREELEKLEVPFPSSDADLNELSKLFNKKLEEWRYKEHKPESTSWFNLFREVDEDASGYITYDELRVVTRKKLAIKNREIPENKLKALWCVLDADDSNMIMPNEIAGFFKRGVVKKAKVDKSKSGKRILAQYEIDEMDMSRVDATIPTRKMRKSLEDSGEELPDIEEILKQSMLWNERLEELRLYASKPPSFTYYNLFKEVDKDNSGFITYDEFKRVGRSKIASGGLGLKQKEMSDSRMVALWCILDCDYSNKITPDEMAPFFKGNANYVIKQFQKAEEKRKPKPVIKMRRKVRPSGELSDGYVSDEPQMTPEEIKAKEAAERLELHLKREADRNRRAAEKAAERAAYVAERDRMRHVALYNMQYKRRMLDEMRVQVMHSPIPDDNGGRIGGGRILTLYESERLIRQMENRVGTSWKWPARERSPTRPSTALVDDLGRLEDLLASNSYSRLNTPAARAKPMTPGMGFGGGIGIMPVRGMGGRGMPPGRGGMRTSSSLPVIPNRIPKRA